MARKRLFSSLHIFSILFFTLLTLSPILWTFISSIRSSAMLIRGAMFPSFSELTFQNYTFIIQNTSLFRFMMNSLVYSSVSALICTLVGVMAGYGLSRFTFPGNKIILNMFLLIMMIPILVVLVPIYFALVKMNFLSPMALIIIYAAGNVPFCTWLIKVYIDTIPRELDEAANIDGSSKLRNLWHIIAPLAFPGYISAVIIVFVNGWNELIFASVILDRIEWKPITSGILGLMGQYGNNWGALNAGAMLACIPVLIIFLLLQKYFIGGLVAGAVKE